MTRKQALQYVKNTNGGATVDNFIEDWLPVGRMEWDLLMQEGLVNVVDDRIFLTDKGQFRLDALENPA